jgi:hypothetical protein
MIRRFMPWLSGLTGFAITALAIVIEHPLI